MNEQLSSAASIELRLAAVEVTVPAGYRHCELRCTAPGRSSMQQNGVVDGGGTMRLIGLEGAAKLRVRGPYLKTFERRFNLQAGEVKVITLD